MEKPDQRLFEEDLGSADFRIGASKGLWDIASPDVMAEDLAWPKRILWLGIPPRPNAPDRFYVLLDLEGYRSVSPTGTFWDSTTKSILSATKRPKGKAESRFAKVFRTDWKNGSAFYHPYDRVAAQSHPEWAKDQPHLVWKSNCTIVDYLNEFSSLFNSGEYLGV